VIACLALIYTVEARVLKFFGVYLLVLIPLYFLYGMRHSRLARGEDSGDGAAVKQLHDEPPMVP